jgi:hypothetical protein
VSPCVPAVSCVAVNIGCALLTYCVALVSKRTIPTERPPLVGEVSANFCGSSVPRDQRDRSLRPYCRLSRPDIVCANPTKTVDTLPQSTLRTFRSLKSKSMDGQSASLSWCQAPISDPRPIFLRHSVVILDCYGFVDVGRPL